MISMKSDQGTVDISILNVAITEDNINTSMWVILWLCGWDFAKWNGSRPKLMLKKLNWLPETKYKKFKKQLWHWFVTSNHHNQVVQVLQLIFHKKDWPEEKTKTPIVQVKKAKLGVWFFSPADALSWSRVALLDLLSFLFQSTIFLKSDVLLESAICCNFNLRAILPNEHSCLKVEMHEKYALHRITLNEIRTESMYTPWHWVTLVLSVSFKPTVADYSCVVFDMLAFLAALIFPAPSSICCIQFFLPESFLRALMSVYSQ